MAKNQTTLTLYDTVNEIEGNKIQIGNLFVATIHFDYSVPNFALWSSTLFGTKSCTGNSQDRNVKPNIIHEFKGKFRIPALASSEVFISCFQRIVTVGYNERKNKFLQGTLQGQSCN